MVDREISSAVSKTLELVSEEVKKYIQKQIPAKMELIKNEIRTEYIVIVRNVFKSVFDSYYGYSYDFDALMDSISFITTRKLYPSFVYNMNKFKFSSELEKQEKKIFNANASAEVRHYRDPDTITEEYLGDIFNEFALDYRDGYTEDDWTEEASEIKLEEWAYKKKNNAKQLYGLTPIEEPYKVAAFRAQQTFDLYFTNTIKSRIFKKYGIKLN